jgi:hypothetical protein
MGADSLLMELDEITAGILEDRGGYRPVLTGPFPR